MSQVAIAVLPVAQCRREDSLSTSVTWLTRFGRVYDICPGTDPSLLDIAQIKSLVQESLDFEDFSKCDSTLGSFNCVQDLGFPKLPGKGQYFANSNLPSPGTKTLYDLPGSVTSPPQGSVFSYAESKTTYLITASPYNAGNAAATGSGSTTASGSAGSTSTSSGKSFTANEFIMFSCWCAAVIMGAGLQASVWDC